MEVLTQNTMDPGHKDGSKTINHDGSMWSKKTTHLKARKQNREVGAWAEIILLKDTPPVT